MNPVQPGGERREGTASFKSFTEWFVRSPLARAMLEEGKPFQVFLPVRCREGDACAGVRITIDCVTPAMIPTSGGVLLDQDRGNGYSSNPPGPLQPGDYGVHSHPATGLLLRRRAADAAEAPPFKPLA